MFGAESIYAARYAGLGLCLNLHPQLALWATGIIASFAGSALCRIVETPEPSTSVLGGDERSQVPLGTAENRHNKRRILTDSSTEATEERCGKESELATDLCGNPDSETT
jgi:hypothetical protein